MFPQIALEVFVFLAKTASSILDYRLQLSFQLEGIIYLEVLFNRIVELRGFVNDALFFRQHLQARHRLCFP